MKRMGVLSWAAVIAIWLAVIAVLLFVLVLTEADALGGHHSDCYVYLQDVKQRESGGDYQAVNVGVSETHRQWNEIGSYGAYQIALSLWEEERLRQGLDEWAGFFPHWTPPEIQDRIAMGICQRFGRCPWLFGSERLECWQNLI